MGKGFTFSDEPIGSSIHAIIIMHIHHYVSTFLQVVALNELKVKWLSIKGISEIIFKYLTEGINLLCVLSKKNTGRLKKKKGGGQWVWKSALSQNNTLVLTILGSVSQ